MPTVTCTDPFEFASTMFAIYPIRSGTFSMASSISASLPTASLLELKTPFYTFILTGQPNITIPISSFQGRFNDNGPGYLSVVIPGVEYADEITDRADTGKMQIFKNYYDSTGAVSRSEMIAEAILDDIRIDEGTTNKSITLSGHKDHDFGSKAITLTGVTSRSELDGIVTLEFVEPDLDLRPGDVLTAGSDTITIDQVQYTVGTNYSKMTVVEVES